MLTPPLPLPLALAQRKGEPFTDKPKRKNTKKSNKKKKERAKDWTFDWHAESLIRISHGE